ncbi:YybH family protein [Mycobacterium kyogaense]|uniref:YybH family protein n=1 Tax=Mycobacterium kyogaense TaxID=2212479 RepID=UPI000DAE9CD6|nr:nuclear transport factor 2 family protein [Mycobacterium kyogaense]
MTAADPLAAVHGYVEAFNAGDVAAMAAAFDDEGTILDGMAPHLWTGPSAVENWYRDVMAKSAKLGASDYAVTVGEPLHNDVSDDTAYLVFPATLGSRLNGSPMMQTGALFTLALRRRADSWLISAWAWSKGTVQQ